MTYFIDKLAKFIKEENYHLPDLTIVLPSQRAKKYLQKAIFQQYKKAVFSPEIITMNQWIQNCNPVPVIDNSRALFKLYSTHQECNKAADLGLDEFLKWGKTLLSDFDEIDRYLIDAKDLFKNLTEIKEIENWSFNNEELTPSQKRFLEFWNVLPIYYEHFGKKLKSDGVCYMGNAYKNIALNIDLVFKENKSKKFIFAGFNAMSKAELEIIRQLYSMGRAKVFIDGDTYYLNNKMHEAGTFLRQIKETLNAPKLDFVVDKLLQTEKNITLYNCVESTGQAKISASILHSEIQSSDYSNSLVLLADESLIVPVIKNLPKNIEKANITLGLPLKNTSLRPWVDLIFRYQENASKYNSSSIYHKDFIQFIKHPFLHQSLPKDDKEFLMKLERDIITKNILFINPKKLSLTKESSDLFTLFFKPWKEDFEFGIKSIRQLNEKLFSYLKSDNTELERTIVVEFDKQIAKFQNLINEFKPKINLNTFKGLLNQHWFNGTIAYYGNPLGGLQIMGLLESRLLDFKNVIVVGLNNMKMPPGNPIQTIIPMDLRKYHGLPTPREKQGLFAHHFYRLLHHAENVWITYSTSEGAHGIEEPSQYIHQIKLELARKNPLIKLREFDYTIKSSEAKRRLSQINKSANVIQRLDKYFKKGTSVSAINTYLRCPMDFYYQYVLGFGEEKQVEEDLEAGTLGSIIHETLEELYKPYLPTAEEDKQKSISKDDVNQMINRFVTVLDAVFQRYYEDENIAQVKLGKNFLSIKMAEHLIASFLKQELEHFISGGEPFYIKSLEEKLEMSLVILVNNVEKEIKIKGVIDRVDIVNNKIRIIDYKSGRCDDSKVLLKKGKNKDGKEEIIKSVKKGGNYLLQLITYLKLYKDNHGVTADQTGIISLVNLKNGPFYLQNEIFESDFELISFYEELLGQIVEEIYDPNIPFEHNLQSNYCSFCN